MAQSKFERGFRKWDYSLEGSAFVQGHHKTSVRIVMVGKTGVGKSATGNTILHREDFHKEASSKSVTKVCKKASNVVDGKNVEVVDTPGWCDTDLSEAEIVQETVKCIDMSYPGPHVFLLVVPIGRFSEEEKKTVRKIQEVFGEGASKYMMVLFTRGDDLEGRSIDDYLQDADSDLKNLVFYTCEGRYHVFNNREKNDHQVSELLQKIQNMVRQNGGECYTNVTYQLLENYKKKEDEMQKMIQTLEKKIDDFRENERLSWRNVELRRDQLLTAILQKIEINETEKNLQAKVPKKADCSRSTQRRMETDELRQKREELQHQQRMESERLKMEKDQIQTLRQHYAEMVQIQRLKKDADAERSRLLKKTLKKESYCSIA